jgi:hypothetical protein
MHADAPRIARLSRVDHPPRTRPPRGSTLAHDLSVVVRGENSDVGGLADWLEPSTPRAARSARGGDIAFADTIHVRDLNLADTGDELPPASGPVIVNDPDQGTQWMTPFAFPLPPASQDLSLSTKLRVLSARVRHGVRGSLEEAHEAWSQTSEAPGFIERVKALWSLWQWERTDLVRAAIIGGAVFLVVATAGAFTMAGDERTAQAFGVSAPSVEVRTPRTVDQHTGRAFAASPKLRARR